MQLNTLKPAHGAKTARKRVGRGIASGLGKTCGRGHKGQHSRSGGYHKVGFEGGQMPFQRRVPKFGFTSPKSLVTAEIRTSELGKVTADKIDMAALCQANLIDANTKRVKVFQSGKVTKPITLVGIKATRGAIAAIEAAGGKIE